MDNQNARLAGGEGFRYDLLRRQPRFGLLVRTQSPGEAELLPAVAELAVLGPVQVLDAGNHFDAIKVAYAIRHITPDLKTASENLQIVRAFTCIEVVKGLQQTPAGAPLIILDLLATFYDEAVSDKRSALLVEQCVTQIRRLAAAAPVVASVRDDGPTSGPRSNLLQLVRQAADLVDEESLRLTQAQTRMF
ncbi:MAG: hypothetical protein KF698_08225 [Anaerolineales bacterium]|nr:hypothetical protein [Anaerolineales bacterium]